MKNFFLKRHVDRIEREGNDDLLLILELGPRAYPTRELHELLNAVENQKEAVYKGNQRLFFVAASISIWIALSFLAGAAGVPQLGYVCLSMIPIACIVLIIGHSILRRKYPTFRHSKAITQIIQYEIERRRKESSIF